MTDTINKDVLMIYTGGTIGSFLKDRDDPLSPLVPAPLEEVMQVLPNYNADDQSLQIEDKKIFLGIYEYENPVDSSNITHHDWIRIAKVIQENYDQYEGFVVLHGTDILAYTASALSFMFANLSKPVIITGSQRPIGKSRTDAIQNLITSIEIAAAKKLGNTPVPEVCVFFRNKLYRGCRASKIDASGFNAFDSPNYPAMGVIGEKIKIHKEHIRKPSKQMLRVQTSLERNVAAIDIFPGMSASLLDTILSTDDLKGVVMRTFGSGNVPTSSTFLETIQRAVENKTIMSVTQCCSGEVEPGLYEASARLLSTGVIPGLDMTTEAALTKLMVVLGMELDKQTTEDMLQINLRGEQRQSIFHLHFGNGSAGKGENVTSKQMRPMTMGHDRFDPELVETAFLRIIGVNSVDGRQSGKIELELYMDLPEYDEGISYSNPHYLGRIVRNLDPDPNLNTLFLAVTSKARDFVDNHHNSQITIVNMSDFDISWSNMNIAFYTNN